MNVQNANVIIKFTRGIIPTLIMREYFVENENIKNIQNYQNYIHQLYSKAAVLNLGSTGPLRDHGDFWLSMKLEEKRITTQLFYQPLHLYKFIKFTP